MAEVKKWGRVGGCKTKTELSLNWTEWVSDRAQRHSSNGSHPRCPLVRSQLCQGLLQHVVSFMPGSLVRFF